MQGVNGSDLKDSLEKFVREANQTEEREPLLRKHLSPFLFDEPRSNSVLCACVIVSTVAFEAIGIAGVKHGIDNAYTPSIICGSFFLFTGACSFFSIAGLAIYNCIRKRPQVQTTPLPNKADESKHRNHLDTPTDEEEIIPYSLDTPADEEEIFPSSEKVQTF